MTGNDLNPEGFGACTKCDCKVYTPTNLYGKCQNTRSDGNTCGHLNDQHKSS